MFSSCRQTGKEQLCSTQREKSMLILRGLKEEEAGPACELVCSGVAQVGTTIMCRHMDNSPYRDSAESAATLSTGKQHRPT